MSRPAIAAWYRCQTSVFSLSGSSLNPSAYTCTTAASSTRSRRYLRSGGAAVAEVPGLLPELPDPPGPPKLNAHAPEPPAHAAFPMIDMIAMTLFTLYSLLSTSRLLCPLNFTLSAYLYSLQVSRDVRRPSQFPLDPLLECACSRRFAVDDERHLRRC